MPHPLPSRQKNPGASLLPPALPVDSAADAAQADLALLALALQGLLAKWPPQVTRRHFPVATHAYRALRIQACLPAATRLPPQVLSDLCHEIAEYVDVSVRAATVRCMRREAAANAWALSAPLPTTAST